MSTEFHNMSKPTSLLFQLISPSTLVRWGPAWVYKCQYVYEPSISICSESKLTGMGYSAARRGHGTSGWRVRVLLGWQNIRV